jgi:hypothetical protein
VVAPAWAHGRQKKIPDLRIGQTGRTPGQRIAKHINGSVVSENAWGVREIRKCKPYGW